MFVETKLTTAEIKKLLTERLEEMGFTPKNASDEMFYKACAGVVLQTTEKHNISWQNPKQKTQTDLLSVHGVSAGKIFEKLDL